MISLSHETQILSTLWSKSVNEIYIARCIMGRQGIKLDKAHAFSSRFLQLCAQEEKALSQWGAIFHTTRQTISNWQTGESVPDIIKLADIAQYFGVSTDYLLGLSDTKSPDAGAMQRSNIPVCQKKPSSGCTSVWIISYVTVKQCARKQELRTCILHRSWSPAVNSRNWSVV